MCTFRSVPAGFAALLCLLTLLTGCGSTASAHSVALRIPAYGGTRLDPGILDPARASTATPLYLASMFNSGLVKLAPDLHVIPELAVSIPTISTDGKTYTFTVRQDARFADGRPCTAADVAYSLARALSPTFGNELARRYLGGIVGAVAVEDGATGKLAGVTIVHRLTVAIRLAQPDATFLDKLAFPVAFVVERSSNPDHPSGLGPWVVATWGRDGSAILAPRPHFYGGAVQVKTIHLIPVSTPARAVELYRHAGLDVAEVPAEQYRSLAPRADFHQSNGLTAYYALCEAADGPLLAATLKRDALGSAVSPALSPLSSIVPPAVPDYVSNPPTVDPGAALGDPATVDVSAPAGDPLAEGLAGVLLRQWKAVAGRGRTRVRLIRATFQLPDPGAWLQVTLPVTHSRWYRSILTEAGEMTNDPVSRMALYSDGENWAIGKGIVIPLAAENVAFLIRPSIGSVQVTPLGIMPENNNWTQVSSTGP